jgi:hypothetical protein
MCSTLLFCQIIPIQNRMTKRESQDFIKHVSSCKSPSLHPHTSLLPPSIGDNLTTYSPTICINSTLPSPLTFAHTANGICTLRPRCALSHCTCPNTATSSPFAKEVSTSNLRPDRCRRMSLKVCAMASGPVCATLEWRRERFSDSGMFLGWVSMEVVEAVIDWKESRVEGLEGWGWLTSAGRGMLRLKSLGERFALRTGLGL